MAIKKINRDELNKKVTTVNATQPVDDEPKNAEPAENNLVDEVKEDGSIEDTDVPADEVKDEKVETPKVTTKTQAPAATKVTVNKTTTTNTNNKGDKKVETNKTTQKKTLGKAATKTETVERTIGTVYPKDLLFKNLQGKLDARFQGINLADAKFIYEQTEEVLGEACQVASVRFLGGVLKAQDRNALVAKAPKVDYASYTAARKVITITGAEIGTPEKYRGHVSDDKTKFIVSEAYNHEDGKWYPAEGEIELDAETSEDQE